MDPDPYCLPYFLLGLLSGVVLSVCALVGLKIRPEQLSEIGMSYADLAAILLGAVAIIVTVLGVVMAILAFWGYSQFRKSSKTAAVQFVKSELEKGKIRTEISEIIVAEVIKQLDDGRLNKIIEDAVNRNIITGPSRRKSERTDESIGDEEKEYGA
jgi:hypothetical protein